MSTVVTSPLSGFRDILPSDMLPRQKVLSTIERVYATFGFGPLETPILERLEILTGKYGDEGEKLMYRFEDQGGRMVALRYDQTVPLARVIAEYQGKLPMPFKRYVVGPVFRGDKPQAGRYRQFTQFDADIVGSASVSADAEIIAMMSDSMSALGVASIVRVNNRRVLDALAESVGLSDESALRSLVGVIDKIDKIGKDSVLAEINEKFGDSVRTTVDSYLSVTGIASEKISRLREILGSGVAATEGLDSLDKVFSMLRASGYSEELVRFDPTIARGLDYYTGTIYETNLIGAEQLGSVCSGGRYDHLIESLGGPDIPAVGTSIGVDRLLDALSLLGKLTTAKTSTRVFITHFDGDSTSYMRLATLLRNAGIPTEIAYDARKGVGDQLKHAAALGIPYALLQGSDEVAKSVVLIRNLETRAQEEVSLEDVVSRIKSLVG